MQNISQGTLYMNVTGIYFTPTRIRPGQDATETDQHRLLRIGDVVYFKVCLCFILRLRSDIKVVARHSKCINIDLISVNPVHFNWIATTTDIQHYNLRVS